MAINKGLASARATAAALGTYCLLAATSAFCATPNYTGVGPGSSIINATDGTGVNYTTLGAAVAAVNATPLTGGDWIFYIDSSLTQATNVALAQNLNGNKLYFRPSTGKTVTVTFSSVTANAGFRGHFLIGVNTIASSAAAGVIPTHNVIIDGYNGTSNRQLTFTGISSSTGSDVIRIVGNCDGVEIKNTNVILGYSSTNARHCIAFTSMRYIGGPDLNPDNALVDNCALNANSSVAGRGIGADNWDSASPFESMAEATGMANHIYRSCAISARRYGILCAANTGGQIYNNTLTIAQTGTIYDSYGIMVAQNNNPTLPYYGWTMDIFKNTMTLSSAVNGAAGLTGICCEFNGTTAKPNTYNVYNNLVVMSLTAAGTPAATHFEGIRIPATCTLVTSPVTPTGDQINANIQHNSVHMQTTTGAYTGLTRANCCGIGSNVTAPLGSLVVRNNIVRMAQASGGCLNIARQPDATGSVTCTYNDLCNAGTSAVIGRVGSGTTASPTYTEITSFPTWLTSGVGLNSQNLDPTVGSGPALGKWTSVTNLKFDNKPDELFAGAPTSVTGITTDIDGALRYAAKPYMGADERTEPLPVALSQLTIE